MVRRSRTKRHAPAPTLVKGNPAPRKARLTLNLPVRLIERVRNAVYWNPPLTLASFAASAFDSKLKKLERRKRIRARKGPLRVGRPPINKED